MPADTPAGPAAPDGRATAGDAASGSGAAADRGEPLQRGEARAESDGPAAGVGGQAPADGGAGADGGGPEGTGAGADGGSPHGGGPHGGGPHGPGAPGRGRVRAGRDLPAALGVGLGMGALAIVTLFTVKATFLIYVGVVAGLGLWELFHALRARGIVLPLTPVAAGGAAALPLAYWYGERALVAVFGITVIVILAWRLPGGASGYLRDVTAGAFALAYVPLMASFVALMLAAPAGGRRTLVFLILTVCSDAGGYFAGILIGRHKMAPAISPKKTWEGFAGSVAACLIAGGITMPVLLAGQAWQGVAVGAAAAAAATLGDLAASMGKRDLEIKDWGALLPGHGGVLDRIDSLLITAPVVWLLLSVFLPAGFR